MENSHVSSLPHSAHHHHRHHHNTTPTTTTTTSDDYSPTAATTANEPSNLVNHESTTAFSNLIQAAAMAAAAVAAAASAANNNNNNYQSSPSHSGSSHYCYSTSTSTSSPGSSSSYQSPPQPSPASHHFRHWNFAANANSNNNNNGNEVFSSNDDNEEHDQSRYNPLNQYNLDKFFAEQMMLRRSMSIPSEIYRENVKPPLHPPPPPPPTNTDASTHDHDDTNGNKYEHHHHQPTNGYTTYASKHAKIFAYHRAALQNNNMNTRDDSHSRDYFQHQHHHQQQQHEHHQRSSQQNLHHHGHYNSQHHHNNNNRYPASSSVHQHHFPSLSSLPLSSKSLSQSLNAPFLPSFDHNNNNHTDDNKKLNASLGHYFYSSSLSSNNLSHHVPHTPQPQAPSASINRKSITAKNSIDSNGCVVPTTVNGNSSVSTTSTTSKRPKSTFPFGRCRVCNDKATGVHYGIATCEGCKGFFKRSTLKKEKYRCFFGNNCPLTPDNRNRCKACRFKKCLEVGMSIQGVKMGRIPKAEKERALMMLVNKNNNSGGDNDVPRSDSISNASENATTTEDDYVGGEEDEEEEEYEEEESESSVNLSESEYEVGSGTGGSVGVNSPTTPNKIEITNRMNKIALSRNSDKLSIDEGTSSSSLSPPPLTIATSKVEEESTSSSSNSSEKPLSTTSETNESSGAMVAVKRKTAPSRTIQDQFDELSESHQSERATSQQKQQQQQQQTLSESQYTKLFSEYFLFKFNSSVANRINQHTLQITASDSLQSNIDQGICLMYPVLVQRVGHAFSRLTSKVNTDYQLKLKRVAANEPPPGHDLTLKDVWAGLLQGIPSSVKNNISYCKLLPGIAQLPPKTFTSLINLNMLNVYLLERTKLFEDGENHTLLANGIQYTRHWMSQVIGNQMTEAIFEFEHDLISLKLTTREQAVLIPYAITKFNHNIDGGEKLKILNEFYRKLLLYVLESNKRESEFVDKIEQMVARFPYMNDLSAQTIGSLTPQES